MYGTDKCGLKDYFVTDLGGFPVPFVRLDAQGTLIMQPIDGRDSVGTYTCVLNAVMQEFPSIAVAEPFACNIPACTSRIQRNNVVFPNKVTNYWGRAFASFNIGPELSKFTIGPACG